MSLFIELYLDEDVDILVAKLLQGRGYAALTTLEAGRTGVTDAEQLDFAASQGRALLTHNRVDFEREFLQWFTANRSHAGIIIATRQTPQEIVRRLLIILDSTTADEMRDQVRYI